MNRRETLGVVGCLVLGDEMAHVLENDPAIGDILIVDTPEGREFREKFGPTPSGQYVQMVDLDELERMDLSGPAVVVLIKGASLHDDPLNMLKALSSSIHALEPFCGSILMFYGLCRNTKYEVRRFAGSFDVPVTFLTDAEGDVVDDCFAAVLGGRGNYLSMIRDRKRTMFLTTGYAEYWAKKLEAKGLEELVSSVENLQLTFDNFGYDRVVMLDSGLGDREGFQERTREFASMLDLSVETVRCDTSLFERSYSLAWSKTPRAVSVRGAETEVVLSRTLP